MAVLPKNILNAVKRGPGGTGFRVSEQLVRAAAESPQQAIARMESAATGLTDEQATERLGKYGHNVVADEHSASKFKIFLRACLNPLVILLTLLATVSFSPLVGDNRAGTMMMLMVVLGVSLRFFQEAKADNAAAALKAMIRVTATVLRSGVVLEIPLEELVPGDVVKLAAGDMIPADILLLSCKDLFVIQSSLTGESLPVEKFDAIDTTPGKMPLELQNICFLGTSVESGTATALVVKTGHETYLGGMAGALATTPIQSSFDKGISQFTWLMIRFMAVMVPLVFIINGITKTYMVDGVVKHNWWMALSFAMAVAVGLTPEMLPMIVTVCLSKGALAMSRKKVIVKRLNSIQNLGAMDILCTDKTGTLTQDHVILERHCDVARDENDGVLTLAYLNSYFQTGLKNVLDRAILQHRDVHENMEADKYVKIDEIPFDFTRRMMSVVVRTPEGKNLLVCKGAPEAVFAKCAEFELEGETHPMNDLLLEDLREEFEDLSRDGFRVLALASRECEPQAAYGRNDEKDLILRGYVAFLDPPKDTAGPAIAALQKHGVAVKVLTGDNELVSKKICREVGLPVDKDMVVLGSQVEVMTDAELAVAAERACLFARLSPAHKQRIIRSLQSKGHVVGFMGDGINDSPALRAADVGVSVDSAVDIAKEAADVILLEKNLMVLEEGVLEGRKVFANILKYVRMGASSNFGNMFSVIGASIFVPFLPMAPMQILANNLLYDFSQVPIPTDEVDPDQITKPRPWDMSQITRFIVFIGPCSSIFDYTTYLMMLFVFKCNNLGLVPPPDQLARFANAGADPDKTYAAALFQTGWFVESLLTQTLIIHIIRTNKIPFIQSRASLPLIVTSSVIMIAGVSLPYTPLGPWLGFAPLPMLYWPLLALTLLIYCFLTQGVKTLLLRKGWI